MKRVTKRRLRHQVTLWIIILLALILSYPAYNLLLGREFFSSEELSFLDILQTTIIITLVYIVNSHRQKIDYLDTTIRNIHAKLSIRLSENE